MGMRGFHWRAKQKPFRCPLNKTIVMTVTFIELLLHPRILCYTSQQPDYMSVPIFKTRKQAPRFSNLLKVTE